MLPLLSAVPEVSRRIAKAVAGRACDEGLADPLSDDEIGEAIARGSWTPEYARIRPLPG